MLMCCRKTSKPLVLARTQMCKRPTTEQNPNEHFLALACRQIRKERPIDIFFLNYTPSLSSSYFLFFFLISTSLQQNVMLLPRIVRSCLGFFLKVFFFFCSDWGGKRCANLFSLRCGGLEQVILMTGFLQRILCKQNVNLRGRKGKAISCPLTSVLSYFL